ncbi:MAG: hypothetical protein ABSC94_30030 [Polyangiaceae bacterium]|jgi:hypothetical protein
MGVERRVLQRAERSGQLEAFKPGRVVMYRRRDIEAFVEAHKVLPGPEPAGSATAELTSADSFERALRHADGRRRG